MGSGWDFGMERPLNRIKNIIMCEGKKKFFMKYNISHIEDGVVLGCRPTEGNP